MAPTREELLAELYKLNKKYERVKQIITKPHYCCFQRVCDEDCTDELRVGTVKYFKGIESKNKDAYENY